MPNDPLDVELFRRLGYRRLYPAWGKVEILLGLTAAGIGLFLGIDLLTQPRGGGWEDAGLTMWVPAFLLFVLGGYLTLAGQRNHLYRSLNDQLRLLCEEIRRHRKADPDA